MRQLIIFICSLSVLVASCNKKHHVVNRGFYYWRTSYALKPYELQRLLDVHCRQVYIHCFDVDWDEVTHKPKPLGVLQFSTLPDVRFSFTPVVFITQKTLRGITPQQIPQLADDITKLLTQIIAEHKLTTGEIQIDCDWTRGTKETYFALLEALKKQPLFQDKTLSCTIRLHQVKYRLNSGIPPVDKGLLMCYNVGDLKLPGAHNSILDVALLKDYLKDVNTYPLKLDVALPLFSWCVQFHKGKMVGILRDVTPENLAAAACFKQYTSNLYRCIQDTIWNGYAFHTNDEIRAEVSSITDINEVAQYTAKEIRNDSLSVLFFHADSVTLSHYSNDEIEKVYHHYR